MGSALAFGLAFLGLLGVTTAWRLGFFTSRFQANALERYAKATGRRVTGDRTGFTAVVDGLPISVRMVVTPGPGVPTTTWRVSAVAIDPVQGHLSVHPKRKDAAVELRIGNVDFDTSFHVTGTSREVACRVLDDEIVRGTLFAFGPHGALSYEDGEATLEWESHEPMAPDEIEAAIAAVHAVCRRRRRLPGS